MTTDTFIRHAPAAGITARQLSNRFRHAWRWLVSWAKAGADQYAAAAMYDELSRLSDADLSRRGLSRANLARDCSSRD